MGVAGSNPVVHSRSETLKPTPSPQTAVRMEGHRGGRSGNGTIAVLGCTCGDLECWPLYAAVEPGRSRVTWSHFRQPCRSVTTAASVPSSSTGRPMKERSRRPSRGFGESVRRREQGHGKVKQASEAFGCPRNIDDDSAIICDMGGSRGRARFLPRRRTARSIRADGASCERHRTGRRSPAATPGFAGRPCTGCVRPFRR